MEEAVIREILQAGRFTPTAGNAQDVSYTVVQKQLEQVKPMVWQGLEKLIGQWWSGQREISCGPLWESMIQKYREDPENQDHLFFGVPVLLIIAANQKVNGWLAASNIELMANAEGLGCLYWGFIERALQENDEAQKLLGLDGSKICACLLLGYPGMIYRRTVPRKELQVTWK